MIRRNPECMARLSLILSVVSLSTTIFSPQVHSAEQAQLKKKKSDATRSLPACLKELMSAGSFDDAERGEAPQVSATYKAYLDAAGMIPSLDRKSLERMLTEGSPAGRLYAAVLLKQSGHGPGSNKAFESLLSDHSKVQYKSGCKVCETTVSEVAQSFIDKGSYLNFRMAVFCTAPLPIRTDK